MARAVDTVFDDRQIADLAAADIASWSAVDQTMVALLGELAASGHRLALISNIPEETASRRARTGMGPSQHAHSLVTPGRPFPGPRLTATTGDSA